MIKPRVVAVSLSPKHTFSKQPQSHIELLAGLGIRGDAHCGATVQHRYLAYRDPSLPNLTQVHLFQADLFGDLRELGFLLAPGELGENITIAGLDLLNLPHATRLHLGATAVIELTGLRTPCLQMNRLRPGLMRAVFRNDPGGKRTPTAGVMGIILHDGTVEPGSSIAIELPAAPHRALECV